MKVEIMKKKNVGLLVGCLAVLSFHAAHAEDWPMWQFDANRSGHSTQKLNPDLCLQWSRELGAPAPAWQDDLRLSSLEFDKTYQPVVMGDMIYVPSMVTGAITAYGTGDGIQKWCFYTEGPIRFAPIAIKGKVYVGSDDGFVYCLNAADGTLLWKFQGAPKDKKCIGNKRVISLWPIRGGLVYENNVLYFGAGSFPFQGIYIYALNAENGTQIWLNSTSGLIHETRQQGHDWVGDNGVAVQGHLVIVKDKLIVPTGRARPAIFDKNDGTFINYNVGFKDGGSFVAGVNDVYFNSTLVYGVSTGLPWYDLSLKKIKSITNIILTKEYALIGTPQRGILKYDLSSIKANPTPENGRGPSESIGIWVKKYGGKKISGTPFFSKASKVFAKSDDLIIASRENSIFAISSKTGDVKWKDEVTGHVASGLVADDKLFVVTDTGQIYCYGSDRKEPIHHKRSKEAPQVSHALAENILKTSSIPKGYVLVVGIDDVELLKALALSPSIQVIAIDSDKEKIRKLRHEFSENRGLGTGVSFFSGKIEETHFPAYFAKEIIVSESFPREVVNKLYTSLHPFGGRIFFKTKPPLKNMEDNEFVKKGEYYVLSRKSGPIGSGWWTHQDGNAGNTLNSADKQVKGKLDILWFGGERGYDFKHEHHSRPKRPQINSGKIVIKSQEGLHAYDIYTGICLWKTALPETLWTGKSSNPGGRILGSVFATGRDTIYVNNTDEILRFDLNTGTQLTSFVLPGNAPEEDHIERGSYISIYKNYIVAGTLSKPFYPQNKYKKLPSEAAACKRIAVLDRSTGEELWQLDADGYYFNTAIVVGNDRVYCVDLPLNIYDDIANSREKINLSDVEKGVLGCYDIKTGSNVWSTAGFGTSLSFSEKNDLLFQTFRVGVNGSYSSGYRTFFRLEAFTGLHGKVVWSKPALNTHYIYHEGRNLIFPAVASSPTPKVQKLKAFVMTTGDEKVFEFPKRVGGAICSIMLSGEHIVTFRSTSAAYANLDDLPNKTSLPGFRTGCTEAMIPAGGIVSCPMEYAAGCGCNFQLQTSLALIPREIE